MNTEQGWQVSLHEEKGLGSKTAWLSDKRTSHWSISWGCWVTYYNKRNKTKQNKKKQTLNLSLAVSHAVLTHLAIYIKRLITEYWTALVQVQLVLTGVWCWAMSGLDQISTTWGCESVVIANLQTWISKCKSLCWTLWVQRVELISSLLLLSKISQPHKFTSLPSSFNYIRKRTTLCIAFIL